MIVYTPTLMIAILSGNDVLTLLWLEIGLIVAFALFIYRVKLKIQSKLMIIIAFILSVGVFFLIAYDQPYSDNQLWINALSITIPTIVVGLSYWILRVKSSQSK